MSEISTPHLYTLTESVSNSTHKDTYSLEHRTEFGNLVKNEEISYGAPQDRNSIGFATEIVQYDLIATGSFNFNIISSAYYTAIESLIRMVRPASLYCGDGTSLRLVMTAGFDTDLYVENSIHLDYVERLFPLPEGLQYSVVARVDSEAGSFPVPFDMSIVDTTAASRNRDMLEALIQNTPSGGSVLMTISLDQGMFPRYGSSHDYWSLFADLSERDDIYVYHIPVSLGVSVLTKR